MVKATPPPQESPHVARNLGPLSGSLLAASPRPEGHRGILQAGSCFSGAVPSLTLPPPHLTPEGRANRDRTPMFSVPLLNVVSLYSRPGYAVHETVEQ